MKDLSRNHTANPTALTDSEVRQIEELFFRAGALLYHHYCLQDPEGRTKESADENGETSDPGSHWKSLKYEALPTSESVTEEECAELGIMTRLHVIRMEISRLLLKCAENAFDEDSLDFLAEEPPFSVYMEFEDSDPWIRPKITYLSDEGEAIDSKQNNFLREYLQACPIYVKGVYQEDDLRRILLELLYSLR